MAASPSPSSDDQFALGSVLDGRYRIDAVLGTGGMGRVYRAEHTKIGKLVAIKVLHADVGRNREASQRFQREAIASGRLDHPNIVGVSDFGMLDDGACYLVMEVLEGESLGDRLARDHRIHWSEAVEILRGVLHGLRHAHERGVVHRDIKPDNVYLARKDGDPIIKILDFGIAKLYAGTDEDPAQTRAGLTVGTPAYLSPEQAVGGEITPKSDLYSASILLYEMLAGRAPFEDKDPLAMLGAHVSRRPPRFAETAPDVDIPLPLEDIMQRGLMKLAAERIASADDYLALLDEFSPPMHEMPRFPTSSGLRALDGLGPITASPLVPLPPGGSTGARSAPVEVSGELGVVAAEASAGVRSASEAVADGSAGVRSEVGAADGSAGVRSEVGAADGSGPSSGAVAIAASVGAVVSEDSARVAAAPAVDEPAAVAGEIARASDESARVAGEAGAVSGVVALDPSQATPAAGTTSAAVAATPAPVTASSLPVASPSLEMPRLPRARRAVSLADVAEPIPQTWIVRSGVFVGVVIAAAIALAIVTHCGGSSSSSTTRPPPAPPLVGAKQAPVTTPPAPPVAKLPAVATKPPPVVATKPPVAVTKPAPAAVTKPPPAAVTKPAPVAVTKPAPAATPKPAVAPKADPRDVQLKALVGDLEYGRTCPVRRAAIAKLVALRHPSAIQPLRKARAAPANGCLAVDAERAIVKLGGTLK